MKEKQLFTITLLLTALMSQYAFGQNKPYPYSMVTSNTNKLLQPVRLNTVFFDQATTLNPPFLYESSIAAETIDNSQTVNKQEANLVNIELEMEQYTGKKISNASTSENIFSGYYYYEPENKARYQAYSEQNPHLSASDVVWRVNQSLDFDFYTNITEIENTDSLPLLVNKYRALPEDFVPQDLVEVADGKRLVREAADAFLQMQADAKEDGYAFYAVSAYRTIEYQKNLYNRYLRQDSQKVVDSYSARAGQSEHNTGRTVDICASDWNMNQFGRTKESVWINENAPNYGFIVRYTENNRDITGYRSEPWHITYVGKEAAQTIRDQNLSSLEEYIEKYVRHSPDDKNTHV